MRTYKPTGRPVGRPKAPPSTTTTPIADWRLGELSLREAAVRFVELCNGVDAATVCEEFGADTREGQTIRAALNGAAKSEERIVKHDGAFYPARRASRRAA